MLFFERGDMNDKSDFSRNNAAEAFENNNETDDPLLYSSKDKDIDHMGMTHLDPDEHEAEPEPEGVLSHLDSEGGMAAEIDQLADMTQFSVEDDISDYESSRNHGMEEPESDQHVFEDPDSVAEKDDGYGKIIIGSVLAIAAAIWFIWPSSEEPVVENSAQVVIEGQQNAPAADGLPQHDK